MQDPDSKDNSTLRLLMPQWQGGGQRPEYALGGQLLAWLAPESDAPLEEVAIDLRQEGLAVEKGIFARQVVLDQARAARRLLDRRRPQRVLVLGGDCSVDFAPFAYLNELYEGDLAILWLDAHPDTAVPFGDDRNVNFHSMVLSALLGVGDAEFVDEVARPLKGDQVLFVGLRSALDELERLEVEHGISLSSVPAAQVEDESGAVLDWLRASGASRVAVHFDLDVLEPSEFGSAVWHDPDGLRVESAVRLLVDVADEFDVVGLGITEYVPRDAILLADMLRRLPVVGKSDVSF